MVPAKYNYFGRLVIIAPARSSLRRFRAEIPLIPAVQIPQTTSLVLHEQASACEEGWGDLILQLLGREGELTLFLSNQSAQGSAGIRQ